MKENYRSVIACQQMKDALERMDSGLLFILSGFMKEGIAQIEANRDRFQSGAAGGIEQPDPALEETRAY